MSDHEDDDIPEDDEHNIEREDQRQQTVNALEFIEDGCERNQNGFLRFPAEFICPSKMCSVNKYVQCVDQTFLQHSMHHIPHGAEFVLVGHDSPSLPTHMFQWIWAMSQINLMKSYVNCVVPVAGLTDVSYSKKGKQLFATNIKRRLVISQAWQIDEQMQYDQWFSEEQQESVMMESVQELRKGNNFYADVPPIQMLWGIIPVEYMHNGVKTRRIFHVLKTIPAPGFDLMRCLGDIQRRSDQKLPNGVCFARLIQVITEVINYECNRNLHISGFFGRSHPLPHPMQVIDDPSCPMNPQTILSPFLVMRKIILQLPVSELADLVIDGFPKTATPEQRRDCFRHLGAMHKAYRERVAYYHRMFARALLEGGTKVSSIQPTVLPLVLSSAQDENLDGVYCYMNMTFNLQKWLDNGTATLEKAELLRMPQLAIATLTPFQYVTMCDTSSIDFIRAHIGDPGEDLDETKLSRKYSLENGSWGDLPHAGMFKNARESIRMSLKTMESNGDDLGRCIQTYQNYLRAQSTIHTQAVLVDLMMSDRVLHCAQCLDRLQYKINESLRDSFRPVDNPTAKDQLALFEAYPDTLYFIKLMHTLSLHNKYIRANAVNLTTLWALLVSDVLTHLGSHHETWNWMMYTVQVMGGAGHMRAQTDDHGSRVQVIFTSKPNSVGFNAIITKTFKALATLVTELLPDLNSDFLEPMTFMKLDRTTRAGVESVSAVMFVNGVREHAPDRKNFMRPLIMDEGYRSMDASALNGLVCSIPRDSDGGSGNILKAVDPGKSGGAHLQGHQRQIPGLSPFLLAMTSNSNPHTTVIGECIKTFSVVTAMFPAGAQPGGKLSSIQDGRKRKLADYQSSNTNAASTMPLLKKDREDLAWIMCVLTMATRQLALVNKTGQTNFEVTQICRMYMEWLRNIIQLHFTPFFSSMLLLSYDRVLAGYLTRQIATCFFSTCARHYTECKTVADANAQILLDMESSPITLQACNLAICNALTHLVDTNVLMVNQLIRDRLNTPVVPVSTILHLLGSDMPDTSNGIYDPIFQWLSPLTHDKPGEYESIMGYILVPKLGSQEDYSTKEAYLESYFGVAKNNYYTYLTAIRECCSKCFDLTTFLSLERSMLDFVHLISRLGVGGDGLIQGYQQVPLLGPNQRVTYLFQQHQPQAGPPTGPGRCWVNVIQHLLLTALQGHGDLHADNIFTFGANLTELIMSQCAPVQANPARALVTESYHHVDEDVIPLHTIAVAERPEYFVRTINDHGALVNGKSSELPAILGAHPPEDVMHLGSWIQLHSIIHSGAKPEAFGCFPEYNGRTPELVMDRRYPLVSTEASVWGTIILRRESATTNVLIYRDDAREVTHAPPLGKWWDFLCQQGLMVAPLVFRSHAAFRSSTGGDRVPWVAIRHPDSTQFLSPEGEYLLARSKDEQTPEHFADAHLRLIPIGSHILISPDAMERHGLLNSRWTLGSLRYPVDAIEKEEDLFKLYISVRAKHGGTGEMSIHVFGFWAHECLLLEERQNPPYSDMVVIHHNTA